MSDVESNLSGPDAIDRALEDVLKEKKVKTRSKDTNKGKEPAKKKPRVQRARDPLIKIVEDEDDNTCYIHEDDISTLRSFTCTHKNDLTTFTMNFTEAKTVSFAVPSKDAATVRKRIQKLRKDRLPVVEGDATGGADEEMESAGPSKSDSKDKESKRKRDESDSEDE